MSLDEKSLKILLRYASLVERQILSSTEYVSSVFEKLCFSFESPCREAVVQIWETVPESLRADFKEAMRRAAGPEFRWKPFYINGDARRKSHDESQQSADLYLARLRAWAVEFLRFWDEGATALTDLVAAPHE